MAKLQRKDLVNEFSLIVQQEIKNHNDRLLANNMAIEEFRREILSLKAKSEKLSASINQEFSSHASLIASMEESFNNTISRISREINDLSNLNREQIKSLKKTLDERESYFLTLQGFEDFKKKIDEWVANIERAFFQQKDAYLHEISKISEKFHNSIELSKNSLEKKIQKEEEARKDQDVSLDVFGVNFEGLKREIEILKKRCFIIEKNAENIYTQIERLKVQK